MFLNIKERIFSINKIWDKLINSGELYGIESHADFKHISNIDFYNKLSNDIKFL